MEREKNPSQECLGPLRRKKARRHTRNQISSNKGIYTTTTTTQPPSPQIFIDFYFSLKKVFFFFLSLWGPIARGSPSLLLCFFFFLSSGGPLVFGREVCCLEIDQGRYTHTHTRKSLFKSSEGVDYTSRIFSKPTNQKPPQDKKKK